MSGMLFGECLGRVVALSGLDVSEILSDQSSSGRRFGDIALSWGLCEPRDVWQAWVDQLAGNARPTVDLRAIGVDAGATADLPRSLAAAFRVVPVRATGEQLVVAADRGSVEWAAARLPRMLKKQVRFVVTDAAQIGAALRAYYPAPAGRADAD